MTNAYGDSPARNVCVTGNASHGLPLTAPPAGAAVDTIISVTNTNVTLSAGPQIVHAVATTVDCGITFPPAASMQGQKITVSLASGSTHNANETPHSGDTIAGSGSAYAITDPGASFTFEALGADWVIVGSAGSLTAPAAPDAPNVLNSSTAVVNYGLYGNASAYGFSGSIDLPTTDPDDAHLRKIHVLWTRGTTVREVAVLFGPWASSPVAWSSGSDLTYLQDLALHSDTITYLVENDDGVVSASPVVKGVTVRASTVTGFASAPAEAGPREADEKTRLGYLYVDFVPVLNGGQVPQNVDYWFSEDNGASFTYINWALIAAVGQAVRVRGLVPGAVETWRWRRARARSAATPR